MSTMPENSTPTPEQPHLAVGLGAEASEPARSTDNAAHGTPTGEAAAAPEGEPWPDDLRAAYPEITAKFRNPAALASAYANLERYFHAFQQYGLTPEQVVAMLDQQAALPSHDVSAGASTATRDTAEEATGGADGIPDDPSAFLDRFAADPRGTVQRLAEEVAMSTVSAMLTAQRMWTEAVERYPDLPKYEQAMTEVLRAAPGLAKFPDVIDRLYRMVAGGTPPADALARARAEAIAQVTGTTMESGRTGAVPGAGGITGDAKIVQDILAGGSPTVIPGLTRLSP